MEASLRGLDVERLWRRDVRVTLRSSFLGGWTSGFLEDPVDGGLIWILRLGVDATPEPGDVWSASRWEETLFSLRAAFLTCHHSSFFFGGSSVFLTFAGGTPPLSLPLSATGTTGCPSTLGVDGEPTATGAGSEVEEAPPDWRRLGGGGAKVSGGGCAVSPAMARFLARFLFRCRFLLALRYRR